MSRSYKKHPWYTDGKNGQVKSKRFANKAVRNYKGKISNGSFYKRIFCSYEIHDYISRWSWNEAKQDYEKNAWGIYDNFLTLKDFYRYWIKHYRSK